MILRKVVLILLMALMALSSVQAQRPQQQQQQYSDSSSAPGEGDIAIMQKEIKWGMQEMQRYKTIRGNWPVRVEPSDQVEDQMRENKRKQVEIISTSASSDEVPTRTVRGARPAVELPEDDSPHATYWKLLVSVF